MGKGRELRTIENWDKEYETDGGIAFSELKVSQPMYLFLGYLAYIGSLYEENENKKSHELQFDDEKAAAAFTQLTKFDLKHVSDDGSWSIDHGFIHVDMKIVDDNGILLNFSINEKMMRSIYWYC